MCYSLQIEIFLLLSIYTMPVAFFVRFEGLEFHEP